MYTLVVDFLTIFCENVVLLLEKNNAYMRAWHLDSCLFSSGSLRLCVSALKK